MKLKSVLLLLISSAIVLASCEAKNAEEYQETSGVISGIEATETQPLRAPHKVPTDKLDFNGEKFRSIAYYTGSFVDYTFANEEDTGDVMSDALWKRASRIESLLNVDIVSEIEGTWDVLPKTINNAVFAGEYFADMVGLHCINGVKTCVMTGCLYSIDALPYVETSAEWWNSKQMDALTFGKNRYFAVNDFLIPTPYIFLFNKEIVENEHMNDPYQLVFDGKWTKDNMLEMAKAAVYDLNGDGRTDENDRYGIYGSDYSVYANFQVGFGQRMTSRDSDGNLTVSEFGDKDNDIFNFLLELRDNKIAAPSNDAVYYGLTIESGKVLFYVGGTNQLEKCREYETEFGILPYPKYDEAQEEYQDMDWGGLICVPSTINNDEKVGAVMELLAYESKNEVLPTYYDVVLQGKLARDENAYNILTLLFESVAYEPYINYFGHDGGIGMGMSKVVFWDKAGNYASYYNSNLRVSQKLIEEFYDKLSSTEG